MLNDAAVKGLLAAGLAVQGAALGLGLAGQGWRWPLVAATSLVALGVFVTAHLDRGRGRKDRVDHAISAGTLIALAAAGLHAATSDPAAAWILRIVFGLQALALLLLLIFLLAFRMTRLW